MSPRKHRPELIPAGVGLGRKHRKDRRDARYPMRAILPRTPEVDVFRRPGPVLDQGSTNACVGFAWRAWSDAGPVMYRQREPDPFQIYGRARHLDEWPDNDEVDDGSSVRAGAKAMREYGRLAEFLWASTTADIIRFLAHRGPVVLGTDWYESMFDPMPDGTVKVDGDVVGGHAYLCYGYDADHRRFRCQNSWGRVWSDEGRFWLRRSNLDQLIADGGEACGAVELATFRPFGQRLRARA